MFIYESKRLKNQINNKDKFIILKSHYLFVFLFILMRKVKTGIRPEVFPNPTILDNEIFIIINKTLSFQIINETYYNQIEYFTINNKKNTTIADDSLVNSVFEINYITIHFKSFSNLKSCAYMFYNLSNIIFADFKDFHFDYYPVINTEYMFSGCKSLISINFGNYINTPEGIDMNNMFSGCIYLLTLKFNYNITLFITNLNSMFYECSSLVSLDLRNFDTSKVTDMRNTFANCSSLKYLVINEFDTSSTNDMTNMFYGCSSLLSLNLYNFNTSSLLFYTDIFKNINRNLIICIDYNKDYVSNFQLESFTKDCNYICLKDNRKFIKEDNICVNTCFYEGSQYNFEYNNTCYKECPTGTYNFNFYDRLCQKYYTYNNNENFTYLPEGYYILDDNSNNIDKCDIKCKNCTKESKHNNSCIACNINNSYFPKFDITINNNFINCYNYNTIEDGYFLEDNKIFMPCYPTCKTCTKLGNFTSHECTSCYSNYILNGTNCNEICIHYYYYNSLGEKICTSEDKCPDNYSKLIIKERRCIDDCKNYNIYRYEYKNICYESYPEGLELSLKTSYLNEKECTALYFFKNMCKINNTNIKNIQNFILKILDSIKNGELNDLLSNVIGEFKDDIIIDDNNISYELTSSYNQNNKDYDNISSIELGQCENILKEIYGIEQNEALIIFKIDYFLEGLYTPIIKYNIFNPKTKEELDQNYCKNIKIIMNVPVSINEKDLDKHNPSSNYYNDICFPYFTEKEVDMTIYDRKIEYNEKNMSLCQNGCEFQEYNIETKKVKCNCDIQSKITVSLFLDSIIHKEESIHKFFDIKKTANLGVIKCYKLFFSKEGLISNIGSYILLAVLFFFFVLSNLFYNKGFKEIKNKIYEFIKIKKANELNNINNNEGNNINIINNNNIMETEIKDKKSNQNLNLNFSQNKNKKIKAKIKRKTIENLNFTNSKVGIFSGINKQELKLEENSYNSNKDIIINNNDLIINNNIEFIDYELNELSYEDALKNDKRTYFNYYLSLLKIKHLILFTFCSHNDYNSNIIKIILFFFSFALFYTINALFFNDSTMHKIYEDDGIYNLAYQINIIMFSSIISIIITAIIKFLSLYQKNILKIKNDENIDNIDSVAKNELICLKKKFISFFIICFIFLLLFWYYLGCFGAVYVNTQIHLIKDTLISFGLSLIYPFFLNLLPGIIRILSLRKINNKYMYKISKIIQII